jgi:hypothetical protein
MTRADVASRVRDLAGPLGPFQSLEDQLSATDDWLLSLGDGGVDELLDLITAPPSAGERGRADDDSFTAVVAELLCRLALLRPAASVPRLVPYLDSDRTRSFAADALGSSRSPVAQRELAAHLLAHPDLAPDQVLPLVEAVAEVGGPETAPALRAVRDSLGARPGTRPVLDLIDEQLAERR